MCVIKNFCLVMLCIDGKEMAGSACSQAVVNQVRETCRNLMAETRLEIVQSPGGKNISQCSLQLFSCMYVDCSLTC